MAVRIAAWGSLIWASSEAALQRGLGYRAHDIECLSTAPSRARASPRSPRPRGESLEGPTMLARVQSSAVLGIDGIPLAVEVDNLKAW